MRRALRTFLGAASILLTALHASADPRHKPTEDERRAAREALRREMAAAGMDELVAAAKRLAASAPALSWDRPEPPSARDDPRVEPARTAMWTPTLEDATGTGGLTLARTNEGSDARARGNAVSRVATLGRGDGVEIEDRPLATRAVAKSKVTLALSADRRIDPQAILRVVRANFGAYRACYDLGLRASPTLAGTVTVKFVIDPSGAVVAASDSGSDLGDPNVVACVVRGFLNLGFAPSPSGNVTVVYPLVFSAN